MESLLAVVEELYLLNKRFTLERIQRVWETYRRWLNPHMMDGGYSLTLDEFLYIVEGTSADEDVEARQLFDRMKVHTSTNQRDQMDLLEFLLTFTVLSRGSWEKKCQFMFQLLDFDIEDEIAEDELAMMITIVCDGLRKFRVLDCIPSFHEIGAMAARGFLQNDIAYGSKMNFTQFLTWCIFHADPQSLMDFITCGYRARALIHNMSAVVHAKQVYLTSDPYYLLQLALHPAPDRPVLRGTVRVVCGPVVGQVTSRECRVMYEFNAAPLTSVSCCAFRPTDPATHMSSDVGSSHFILDERVELALRPYEPLVAHFKALTPATTYILCLMGNDMAPSDANAAVAQVTTLPTTTAAMSIQFFNHWSPKTSHSTTTLGHNERLSYDAAFDKLHHAPPTSQTISVHWNVGCMAPRMVLETLRSLGVAQPTRRLDEDIACSRVASHFRASLAAYHYVYRVSSNLFVTSWSHVMYGHFTPEDKTALSQIPRHQVEWLEAKVQHMCISYLHSLWPADTDSISFGGDVRLLLQRSPHDDIARRLLAGPTTGTVVVVTSIPLLPLAPSNSSVDLVDSFMTWKLRANTSRLVVVACAPPFSPGYMAKVSLQNTSSSFVHLVCGSLRPTLPFASDSTASLASYVLDKFVVETTSVRVDTHIATVVCIQTSRRSENESTVADDVTVELVNTQLPEPLQLLVGPVVGLVTSSEASILLEVNREVVLVCHVIDRLTQATITCHQRTVAYRPVVVQLTNLLPQRCYDFKIQGLPPSLQSTATFHTRQVNAPALHVTCVSHDQLFPRQDQAVPFSMPVSAWQDLATNELTFPSSDATLYVGQHLSTMDAAHEAMRVWEADPSNTDGISTCFRHAIRRHWQENQLILRRGSHWFVGSGWDWSQYTVLHLSQRVVECAERVAWEYQQHAQTSAQALHRYSYHTLTGHAAIGVLHLDVLEHRLATTHTYLQHTPELLSPEQWALVDQVLAPTSSTAHCLAITCDVPIVWHVARSNVEPTLLWRDWIMYPTELRKLLELVAAWKAHDEARNVLFVCGGPLGVKSTIQINETGVTVQQLVVGPVANPVESTIIPKSGDFLDRFTVDHSCSSRTSDTQYATVTAVPHPSLAQFCVHQVVTHQPSAKVLVGPVLGKITATSVRVLLEVNSAVDACTCVCTNVQTQERHIHTRSMQASLPAAFVVSDLQPLSHYAISFEGIAWTVDTHVTTFQTPHNHPFAFDCVLVHDSDWRNLTDNDGSLWREILTSAPYHATDAAATATNNGDGLNRRDNLWQTIHDTTTALPLRRPLLLVHIGGQVHMKHAFTDKELVALVRRMLDMPKDEWNRLMRPEIQHRMQQVYRVQWNIPPFRDALRVCGNVMLVDEPDLYFSASLVESTFDDRLADVAEIVQFIREIAQFVWLYYQNQLWLDVVPDDVLATRTASFVQYGHCTLAILNKNLNPPVVDDPPPSSSTTTSKKPMAKRNSTKSAGIDLTKVAQANNLLPPAAWLVLDDAIIGAKHNCKLMCVVVCCDLLEASMASIFLIGVTRLLEKVFDWKNQRLNDRNVAILMQSTTTTDTYIVTDQRSHATLRLIPVGSITSSRRLNAPSYPIDGGHFSKRFTFARDVMAGRDGKPSSQAENAVDGTKGYGHVHVTSDLDVMQWYHVAHWLPFTKPCYAITGPIVGRMQVVEPDNDQTFDATVHVCIVLEVNAAATITCVVVDVLANIELRFAQAFQPNTPTTIRCTNLEPSTRYAYTFEGLANRDDRQGVFHTPDAQLNAINIVAVSTNFPQDRATSSPNLWEALHTRLQVPWHGIDVVAHVGGQAPMQSAANECLGWLQSQPKKLDDVTMWKERVRTRFQQEYRVVWNTPFLRTVLSHTSQLMVLTAADVASFFGRSKASLVKEGRSEEDVALMQLVVACAKDVAALYYGALGWRNDGDAPLDGERAKNGDGEDDEIDANNDVSTRTRNAKDEFYSIRMGLVAMFVFDMRATEDGDLVTCNKRLATPPTERPLISEDQWLAFESVCRKKSVRVLVLLMEFPLLLSGNVSAFAAAFNGGGTPNQENDDLYNTTHLAAHWLACPAQLHALISLLFRWKQKIDGRDVVVVSGNLRFGLDTFIQDTSTSFGFHNYVTGPIAAAGRPFGYEDAGTTMDKRIAFTHRFAPAVANYVLVEISILEETLPDHTTAHSALVNGDVVHADNVRVLHDLKRLNRWPQWWRRYCPMAATAFWTDLVVKSEPPHVQQYIRADTALTNLLKPLYAKYNFIDSTRMDALQSTPSSPTAAWTRFQNVLREVWQAMPMAIRQMCADVRDEFVVEIARAQVQLDMSGPIDMTAFQSICKDILTCAARTHVAMTLHKDDDDQATASKREETARAKELERRANVGAELRRKQEEAHLAELQQRSILEYAQEKNRLEKARQDAAVAEREAAKAAKKAARDAEKERQRDEDVSIRKEKSALKQMKLTLDEQTAAGGPSDESLDKEMEWTRRSRILQARIQRREEQRYREGVRRESKQAKKNSVS
ncbi:hypothetical protein H257_03703 [Aphanomyces astaci]|uniref:Uncharacterized protein n=1 Tax=Aphanomyces astaci TaxID=112090 RepID=W4H035_APHAT|nr:hypothetical protein H257_03703 [Aphanomyces astaci]ETV84523.1 hypothetical protein H257_03703 [Aphanomyces astaci]|eukprot:XP_009826215.1 hypothetical protein H257_03703 [Aphanomyces astaci]